MRKLIILTVVIVMAIVAIPVFSQTWEVGASFTPIPGEGEEESRGEGEGMDAAFGFHFGYGFYHIFYITWDSIVMPPSIIYHWTGYNRPGFLNLFDAGVRFLIGPFVLYSELGLNNVYVYKQGEDNLDFNKGLGANLRLGLGLKFGWWGVNLSGTSVFPSFKDMTNILGGLASDKTRDLSLKKIKEGLVPSLNLVLYF